LDFFFEPLKHVKMYKFLSSDVLVSNWNPLSISYRL